MLWNTYCYYQLKNKFINYIVLLIITEIEKNILLMQKVIFYNWRLQRF